MTQSTKNILTSKWVLVVQEYELIKTKQSKNFTKIDQLCSAFQVNRKDIQKYYQRWLRLGRSQEALLPQKRGPKPGTTKTLSKEEERTIIKIRRKLNANEFEILELLQGHFNAHPSVSTIYRTFKRYPLNAKRKQKIKRYEKLYPGEQAHSDTYRLPKNLFLDRQQKYLFGLLDDCTRLCYVAMVPNLQAATIAQVFFGGYKWFHAHGFKINEILTDNGGEYTAYTSRKARDTHFFETMLNIFNIRHVYTRPYHPQTNGKIERFWRILYDECIKLQTKALEEKDFLAELNGFMYRYNYQRRHSGLKRQTPLEKLIFVTEIMK